MRAQEDIWRDHRRWSLLQLFGIVGNAAAWQMLHGWPGTPVLIQTLCSSSYKCCKYSHKAWKATYLCGYMYNFVSITHRHMLWKVYWGGAQEDRGRPCLLYYWNGSTQYSTWYVVRNKYLVTKWMRWLKKPTCDQSCFPHPAPWRSFSCYQS